MGIDDLESLIDKVNKSMELLADIDLYSYNNGFIKKQNQRKLIRSYDILFKTKNHLKYLKKKAGN